MSDAWYYRYGESQVGPIPKVELDRLLQTGQLNPATPVWCQGMAGWAPASYGTNAAAPDDGLRFLIPTKSTSAWSLTAGYVGIFCIFIFPIAPLAIVFGILGIRDLKRNPEKNGWGRAITGIVLGGLVSLGALVFLVFVLTSK